MFTEDKLSREERLRLEALALAVTANGISGGSDEDTIKRAQAFADFIKNGSADKAANRNVRLSA